MKTFPTIPLERIEIAVGHAQNAAPGLDPARMFTCFLSTELRAEGLDEYAVALEQLIQWGDEQQ